MPDDIGGMEAAMLPICAFPEHMPRLVEASAIDEQVPAPLQIMHIALDDLLNGSHHQRARGMAVVLPERRQLLGLAALVALVQVAQAESEHQHPALRLIKRLPGVLPPEPMLHTK